MALTVGLSIGKFPNRCIARRSGRKLDDVVEAGGQSGWIDIKGELSAMEAGSKRRKEGNGRSLVRTGLRLISAASIVLYIVLYSASLVSGIVGSIIRWKWLFPFPG